MKIAVTGASGHIGNCLVRELISQGARIKGLVHNFRNDLDAMDIELIEGNLLDPVSLAALCDEVDVVFHLAATIAIDNRKSDQVYATNVTGTRNLITAANNAGVKKFIHFSSIDAFQPISCNQILDEKGPLIDTNESVYGFSKATSEREVLKAAKEGLNAIVLSPTAVIGPFDYRGSILGHALLKIYRNQIPFVVPGGYNWVDVRDVVAAAIQAIENGKRGEKYILSGTYCSLKELTVMIRKISGCRIPWSVPVLLARLACPFFHLYASVTRQEPLFTAHSLDLLENSPLRISFEKAKMELGFNPRSLEQTLVDTFSWYDAIQLVTNLNKD